MRRHNLDRDEPLVSLPHHFSGYIGELFDLVIPCSEGVGGLCKDTLKCIVGGIRKAVGGKDSQDLVVEVPRDSFDEWKTPPDGVGRQPELAIDVAEYEAEGFLNLVQVRRREKLVQGEIFHQLVVVVNCGLG